MLNECELCVYVRLCLVVRTQRYVAVTWLFVTSGDVGSTPAVSITGNIT